MSAKWGKRLWLRKTRSHIPFKNVITIIVMTSKTSRMPLSSSTLRFLFGANFAQERPPIQNIDLKNDCAIGRNHFLTFLTANTYYKHVEDEFPAHCALKTAAQGSNPAFFSCRKLLWGHFLGRALVSKYGPVRSWVCWWTICRLFASSSNCCKVVG